MKGCGPGYHESMLAHTALCNYTVYGYLDFSLGFYIFLNELIVVHSETMAMSVVTTQPGMALLAPGVKTEMWTSGICDCFEDMQTC